MLVDHHLGNTVLALPSINATASYFYAGADLLVDERFVGIASRIEGLNSIHPYPAQRGGSGRNRDVMKRTVSQSIRLFRKRYRAVISLTGGVKSPVLSLLTASPVRVGSAHYRRQWCYTHAVARPPNGDTVSHAAENYISLHRGISHEDVPSVFRIEPEPDATARIEGKLRELWPEISEQGESPLAVLHPSAGVRWRCWPAERFAEVAQSLTKNANARVLIVGTEDDRDIADQIIAGVSEASRVRFASWSLEELIALLAKADVLVSNESGPTHLASVIGTPIVTIFGPSNEHVWAPRPLDQARLTVLRGAECDPACEKRSCAAEMRCLRELRAERVIHETMLHLDRA